VSDLLATNPVLLLAVLLAVGSALGAVHVRGVALGPAAVLFVALAASAIDARLELPEVVGVLGLALFAYCVGVTAGPNIAAAIRSGRRTLLLVAAVLVAAAAVTWLAGSALGLSPGLIAGTYAGALTNTPALAAATEGLGGSPQPTVAYSLTYLGGVFGMLGLVGWSLRLSERRPTAEDRTLPEELVSITVRVTRRDLPTIAELETMRSQSVRFSRVRTSRGLDVAAPDVALQPGDLAVVVGPAQAAAAFADWLGDQADEHLPDDRRDLDMRRMTIADPHLSGRTVAELDLAVRFGALVTRVRRGDVDLLATPDLVVQTGDRVRVIAHRDDLPRVAGFLGDSERGVGDINPVGLGLGLALGLAAGQLAIPTPIGPLRLGSAAGPLLAGLLLGHLGRTGPVSWRLPYAASATLQQVGVLMFLAFAGSLAGGELLVALRSPSSVAVIGLGLTITMTTGMVVVVTARRLGLGGPRIAGLVAGTQTQPAVLAFARDRSSDERVMVGYALAMPVAMVTKIVAAQVLATL
jgi:putative transport protein